VHLSIDIGVSQPSDVQGGVLVGFGNQVVSVQIASLQRGFPCALATHWHRIRGNGKYAECKNTHRAA
jgi:hypothetical protein